jgi:hypothetical protein
MSQGKIERWHQTLKNRILLGNYFRPGDLEAQITTFVADYHHRPNHESIGNLTPAQCLFRGAATSFCRTRKGHKTDYRRVPVAPPAAGGLAAM